MKIEVLMSELFGFSPQTYFNWKKDEKKRPIISLLNKYFTKKDLIEFLETGKIKKFEKEININDIIPKLYQFNKYSLLYFYFLLENENNIKDVNDFKIAINQDITNTQKSLLDKFFKFLKSIKYSYTINEVSLNSFAQEFKNTYIDNISDDEIDFILKDHHSRNILKLTIDFIISNKMYKKNIN